MQQLSGWLNISLKYGSTINSLFDSSINQLSTDVYIHQNRCGITGIPPACDLDTRCYQSIQLHHLAARFRPHGLGGTLSIMMLALPPLGSTCLFEFHPTFGDKRHELHMLLDRHLY